MKTKIKRVRSVGEIQKASGLDSGRGTSAFGR